MSLSLLEQKKGGVAKLAELLLGELRSILPKIGGSYFFDWTAFQGLAAELVCSNFSTLRANRQRGGSVPIVPLFEGDHKEFKYWLSLYQEWLQSPRPQSKGLVYYNTSLTVFYGPIDHIDKIQLFRAEWPGVRFMKDKTLGFEAQGAGHPHWQFDAYQGRAIQVEAERRRLDELTKALQNTYEIEDFGQSIASELQSQEDVELGSCLDRMSRVHFASLANWPSDRWSGDDTMVDAHARGPASTNQLLNWVVSTLIYIQQELRR